MWILLFIHPDLGFSRAACKWRLREMVSFVGILCRKSLWTMQLEMTVCSLVGKKKTWHHLACGTLAGCVKKAVSCLGQESSFLLPVMLPLFLGTKPLCLRPVTVPWWVAGSCCPVAVAWALGLSSHHTRALAMPPPLGTQYIKNNVWRHLPWW